MKEQTLLIVEWVNALFGPPVASLLGSLVSIVGPIAPRLGLHAPSGEEVIPTHVVMATFVLLFCFAFFGYLRSRLSVENPGKLQQVVEVAVEFLGNQMEEIVGHDGRRFLALVGTLGIFILFSNLLGLIPGMASPTGNINVPAGCAITVFLYYHYHGMRKQGFLRYLKHFAGPVWWLSPLMIPIETISHLARPFSLTVRLFANIFAEDLLIVVFFGLVPFLLPLPFMAFAIFGGLLQAFIFVTLTMVYLGGAVATEEH